MVLGDNRVPLINAKNGFDNNLVVQSIPIQKIYEIDAPTNTTTKKKKHDQRQRTKNSNRYSH